MQKLSKNKGKITLTLTDKNIENIKKVELIFSSTPLKLKKWIITDNQEGETIVALINTKKVKRFSSKTFKLIEN